MFSVEGIIKIVMPMIIAAIIGLITGLVLFFIYLI